MNEYLGTEIKTSGFVAMLNRRHGTTDALEVTRYQVRLTGEALRLAHWWCGSGCVMAVQKSAAGGKACGLLVFPSLLMERWRTTR